jgi:hypothetical protein
VQTDPPPHWFWVAVGVGLAAGVSSVVLGWLLAVVGQKLELHSCQNDAGCLWLLASGLFAAPFCAAGGALVAGVTAVAASKKRVTAQTIWLRSFGFGFLASLLSAVVGLAALPPIFR